MTVADQSKHMSLELEVLDQLLGGPMKLSTLRKFFESDKRFVQAISGLLHGGDIEISDERQSALPEWRWRRLIADGDLVANVDELLADLTEQGARKVS